MPSQSLLDQAKALQTQCDDEINRLHAEIAERQAEIRELRAMFPNSKRRTHGKRPPTTSTRKHSYSVPPVTKVTAIAQSVLSHAKGEPFSVREIMGWSGFSESLVRGALEPLKEVEFLRLDRGSGRGPHEPALYAVLDREAISRLTAVTNGGNHAA